MKHALVFLFLTASRSMSADEAESKMMLKDLEGWDTEDIAMHLGISRDLVRQRLHRARLGLRGHLGDFAAQVRSEHQPGDHP